MNTERERLLANVLGPDGWKHWGPYLSERQWGTVRRLQSRRHGLGIFPA